MNKAYKFRIYPTPQQEEFFKKEHGICRLFWNVSLAAKNNDHNVKLEGPLQMFQKYKPEAVEWFHEVDSWTVTNEWSSLTKAFNNFFSSCSKQRKGKFVKPPKFKSRKTDKLSLGFHKVSFKENGLFLTRKVGLLKGVFHRFAEGKLRSCTVSQTATGKWFVSILVEKKEEKKCDNGNIIGIDWNCGDADFLVRSDGTRDKCPRYMKRKEKHLGKAQKVMSRRYVRGAEKQSNNYYRAKQRVAVIHEKIAWQRNDWLHKLSREIANNYEFVAVEDINLQVMASNLHHGKVVGDQGFGMLRQMLSYKTNLVKVNPKHTSQTCSACGSRNTKLTLSDREWTCPVCKKHHDRDINAAQNILRLGVKSLGNSISTSGTYGNLNACGAPRSAMKQESPKPCVARNEYLQEKVS